MFLHIAFKEDVPFYWYSLDCHGTSSEFLIMYNRGPQLPATDQYWCQRGWGSLMYNICFFFSRFGWFILPAFESHKIWLFNSPMFCSLSWFPCIFILCLLTYFHSSSVNVGRAQGPPCVKKLRKTETVLKSWPFSHLAIQTVLIWDCGSMSMGWLRRVNDFFFFWVEQHWRCLWFKRC